LATDANYWHATSETNMSRGLLSTPACYYYEFTEQDTQVNSTPTAAWRRSAVY